MASSKPKLRKREIAFAVALGALAAGISGVVIAESRDSDSRPVEHVERVALADHAEYKLPPFSNLATTGDQEVVVTVGEPQAIRAEGSPEAIAMLEAVVEDGRLVIRPREDVDTDDLDLDEVTFFVTVPSLDGVTIMGSGNVRIDRVENESFDASIAGSGDLGIGKMAVQKATFSIGGSGNIQAGGTADELQVMIGGAGQIDGAGLRSRTADLTIGGSGDIALVVDERAKIAMLGAGDVVISGSAQCSVTRLGGGDVSCGGELVED